MRIVSPAKTDGKPAKSSLAAEICRPMIGGELWTGINGKIGMK
jgi:hypothetical protein